MLSTAVSVHSTHNNKFEINIFRMISPLCENTDNLQRGSELYFLKFCRKDQKLKASIQIVWPEGNYMWTFSASAYIRVKSNGSNPDITTNILNQKFSNLTQMKTGTEMDIADWNHLSTYYSNRNKILIEFNLAADNAVRLPQSTITSIIAEVSLVNFSQFDKTYYDFFLHHIHWILSIGKVMENFDVGIGVVSEDLQPRESWELKISLDLIPLKKFTSKLEIIKNRTFRISGNNRIKTLHNKYINTTKYEDKYGSVHFNFSIRIGNPQLEKNQLLSLR